MTKAIFILLSRPLSHGLRVTSLNVQMNASFSRGLYLAEKIPSTANTIRDTTHSTIMPPMDGFG